MRLLMVEDNAELADWLARLLRRDNYVVDILPNAEAAIEGADLASYDIAIIDLNLPGADGFAVVRHLRAAGHTMPILILTARDALESRVAGLNSGADDYLTKPFEIEELEARLRALARRSHMAVASQLNFGRLKFDLGTRGFSVDNTMLLLTPREHSALEALMRRAGTTVAKETILEKVYGADDDVNQSAVEVLVHRLRKKIAGSGATIATLRGLGYLLRLDGLGVRACAIQAAYESILSRGL